MVEVTRLALIFHDLQFHDAICTTTLSAYLTIVDLFIVVWRDFLISG